MKAGVDDKASNAITFAHELGHNMGFRWVIIFPSYHFMICTCLHIILDSSSPFRHDFPDEKNPGAHWDLSYGCNKKGIMSYELEVPVGEWSKCSREDQERVFRNEQHVCMKADGGSSPGDGLVSCGFHKAKNCAGCPQVVHQYSF